MSNQALKPDLRNQQTLLDKFWRQQAIEVDEWVLEVGGGLNFERKQFLKLVVMNTETLSPEQGLVQDLMSIVDCFSSRLYGLRNYRTALKKALADEHRTPDSD